MAKSNSSQRETAENKTMKQQLKNISRDMKVKATEEKRADDIKLLKLVASKINQRIIDVTNMKRTSRRSGKTLRKDDTAINNKVLMEYLSDIDYNEQDIHSMTTLIGSLLDIARCQVKDQISSYHIAIRLMLFGRKFYAYFGENFLQQYQEMVDANEELFNSWNLKNAYFDSAIDGKTIYVKVPINASHTFSKVKPDTLIPSNKSDDEELAERKATCRCENETCECGGKCKCEAGDPTMPEENEHE